MFILDFLEVATRVARHVAHKGMEVTLRLNFTEITWKSEQVGSISYIRCVLPRPAQALPAKRKLQ